MSIEIARGCTEGGRFCQAGMIYRPVRERDPQQVIDTLVSAIEKGGFDEAAITSLSTADYSCISPLIKEVMRQLRDQLAKVNELTGNLESRIAHARERATEDVGNDFSRRVAPRCTVSCGAVPCCTGRIVLI